MFNLFNVLSPDRSISSRASDFLSNSMHSEKSYRTPDKSKRTGYVLPRMFSFSSRDSDDSRSSNGESFGDNLDHDIRVQLKGAKWLNMGNRSQGHSSGSLSRSNSDDGGSFHSVSNTTRSTRTGTDCSDSLPSIGETDASCLARECADDIWVSNTCC